MANDPRPHLKIAGYNQSLPYQYPRAAYGSAFSIIDRNRAIHGRSLMNQLNVIREQFRIQNAIEVNDNIIRDDVVYVEFTSEWGYELRFDSLDKDTTRRANYQLLNVRKEERDNNEQVEYRYHATLLLKESGVSSFIAKVNQYLTENIFVTDKESGERVDTGNPKNNPLLSNIHVIRLATLKAFWTDAPEIPFPETEESIWWEVWFRKTTDDDVRMAKVFQNLHQVECIIGQSELELAEHRVRLIKGTVVQLAQSLLLLDNLAELRKPQEIANFIFHKEVAYQDVREYLDDLQERTIADINDQSTIICVIDSGVNNVHPLIAPFMPDSHRYTLNPAWGHHDSEANGGHGTGVTSLALYGDLVDVIASPDQIRILHAAESYKIFNPHDRNNPELYAAITEEAANAPIVDRPLAQRVYCMTITDESFALYGKPSAWSAALDKIAFGTAFEPKYQQVFIVSGGNVSITQHDEYPAKNHLESIHDPGQAYNAITVGSYTRKDRIDIATGLAPLALNGHMAPSNSTSLLWDPQWPNKPDIVMEGGNSSTDGTNVSDHSSLKILAADAEYPTYIFLPFGDTSGAAALAAKLAAELRTEYPSFWPETIRGLMIHSAEWTTQMLNAETIRTLNEQQKKNLLRTFGYGVPNLDRARHSAKNSLTLIAEREIKPYKKANSTGQYNEYHLFELPWPAEVLESLQEIDATLTVTLSYYIEPNPGAKRYSNSYQYHSHALDFAVIKPNERLEVFKRRISARTELAADAIDNSGELWFIGRSGAKGSIRKDFVTMSAIEMSRRHTIAVYPKNGWYKTRKKLDRFDEVVRYSLIVSIRTEGADLYTPVLNQIPNIHVA
ncbi:MAG: S8 family peptidase [Bacteroidota bacterium]